MPAPIAPLLLLGGGLLLAWLASGSKKPSGPVTPNGPIVNPWRGSGTDCEKDFDARSVAEQQSILKQLAALDAASRQTVLACTKPVINAPVNPWRGTGSVCEKDFDTRSIADQQAVLTQLANMSDAARANALACPRAEPPPVDPVPDATLYKYTIQGNAEDSTPYGLCQAWAGNTEATTLAQLADLNPTLQHVDTVGVVYALDSSSAATFGINQTAAQTITVPSAAPVDISVGDTTPVSTNWPGNPMPGSRGRWQPYTGRTPGISPWAAGQTVLIPKAWGKPPTSTLLANSEAVPDSASV